LFVGGANIVGSLFLKRGFKATGQVHLIGTRIGGTFECGGSSFRNPSGTALSADRIIVSGSVDFDKGFLAEGRVSLVGATIGGDFACRNGTFKNRSEKIAGTGVALDVCKAKVAGCVNLNEGFRAEGEVHLIGAEIGGDLDCEGGEFENPPQGELMGSGTALKADDLNLKGSVLLGKGFVANGKVSLVGARVGGSLYCDGGRFGQIDLAMASVRRNLLLGVVPDAKHLVIDLTDAAADVLIDEQSSWPGYGNICLDGFVYRRIIRGPTDSNLRLFWLARQRTFTPQPYRQLAMVLRGLGDDRGARDVLYEMENFRRKQQMEMWRTHLCHHVKGRVNRLSGWGRYWLARVCGGVLKESIGYGYRVQRTIYCLAALMLVGAVFFHLGYSRGCVTPTDKDAYSFFKKRGWVPPYYPEFSSVIYSLENSAPLLRLGQDSAWAPDPAPRRSNRLPWWLTAPALLRLLRRVQIISGWLLATLFVSGVTGIVRKE